MQIALIGGTGFVGSAILAELLRRGHQVTALARQPGKYTAQPGLRVVQADVLQPGQVADAVRGADAVVDAYNPGWSEPRIQELFLQGSRAIVQGVRDAGVQRLLKVGGAGSLFIAPGLQLVDTPEFPAEYKPGALAARDALTELRGEKTLAWTFLSPPILLTPGASRGPFRTGDEAPLMNADGSPGTITVGDLAVAIADELETPRHLRARFTVAY